LLLAAGVELLEIGPQVTGFLLVLEAGKHHFGTGNPRLRILDVVLEGRLVPHDARGFVCVSVIEAFDTASLAAVEAIEFGTDLVLGPFANRMAGNAFLK